MVTANTTAMSETMPRVAHAEIDPVKGIANGSEKTVLAAFAFSHAAHRLYAGLSPCAYRIRQHDYPVLAVPHAHASFASTDGAIEFGSLGSSETLTNFMREAFVLLALCRTTCRCMLFAFCGSIIYATRTNAACSVATRRGITRRLMGLIAPTSLSAS